VCEPREPIRALRRSCPVMVARALRAAPR